MNDPATLSDWVDPARSALLVIDMQNDFCHPDGAFAKRGLDISMAQEIIPTLQRLMAAAREAHVPVAIVRVVRGQYTGWPALDRLSRHNFGPDFVPVFVEGTWGAELLEGFEPKPGDIALDKNRYGAFTGTNLDLILRNKGVSTLIVSGGATNVCVESTVREGFMLDYDVVLVEDACATVTPELQQGTIGSVRGWFGRVERAESIIACWAETH
ncbi:MAG: isochorismatase family cysteine hydrolase [Actinomycetota bacterium]